MRCFRNIAHLIRNKRLQHPKGYSQSELSHLLGYKNGQFISNVERALCNIPLKMLGRVSEVLDIDSSELKEAILRDHDETLNNYLRISDANTSDLNSLHLTKDETITTPQEFVANSGYKMTSNS
ncbi:MAG: helix-turn-helix transcriptional regulator [Bacteriovoracaceae bacterium]|jgi:transcriptional regulator with XRE-family HTH domain|nr:helix-turn-helix transcriptional regulator [Bacteriovoracaceae bacterium]